MPGDGGQNDFDTIHRSWVFRYIFFSDKIFNSSLRWAGLFGMLERSDNIRCEQPHRHQDQHQHSVLT